MKFRLTCIGLGALALAGCGVPHRRYSLAPPERVSPRYPEKNKANNVTPPNPVEAKAVSLHGILAYGDLHSPLLAVSNAELLRGKAAVEAASPLFPSDPSISLNAGPRLSQEGTGFDVQISLEQQLEISGARKLRREASQRFLDVKNVEVEESRWLVHQRIHTLFHQVLVARNQSLVANEFLTFAESLVSIAERRLKAGDISVLGVRVAQGELAQARQAKIAADGAYRSLQLSLAEIAGWPAEHLPVPDGKLDEPRKSPTLGKLLALAEKSNRGLRVRIAETRFAEANKHLSDRMAWPMPTITVQLARESNPALGIGGAADAYVAFFGVEVPIPLWRRNISERAEAKAAVAIARSRHTSEKQQLTARVAKAANEVNVWFERITSYGDQILPVFESNLEMLQKAFELGEIEILDVTIAQRRFLELQQNSLAAYQGYYQSIAVLEQLVGAEICPGALDEYGDLP